MKRDPAHVDETVVDKGLPHRCRCGARWGGLGYAHCSACHETFSTVRNFDKHRSRSNSTCLSPETVGLRVSGRRNAQIRTAVWSAPNDSYDYGAA